MFRVAWSETQDQYQFDFEISGWILKQKQKKPNYSLQVAVSVLSCSSIQITQQTEMAQL